MELVILPDGQARTVYQEDIDLSTLGATSIQRASHVEPDAQAFWWVDLGLINGPKLGPFPHRSDAITSEINWLSESLTRQNQLTS